MSQKLYQTPSWRLTVLTNPVTPRAFFFSMLMSQQKNPKTHVNVNQGEKLMLWTVSSCLNRNVLLLLISVDNCGRAD